jgi:hypothetical protein
VANETAVQQEALRLGLVKTTKEIAAQQKQLAILSIIKRQSAAASGTSPVPPTARRTARGFCRPVSTI